MSIDKEDCPLIVDNDEGLSPIVDNEGLIPDLIVELSISAKKRQGGTATMRDCGISAKEPSISAKEPSISAKEPSVSA